MPLWGGDGSEDLSVVFFLCPLIARENFSIILTATHGVALGKGVTSTLLPGIKKVVDAIVHIMMVIYDTTTAS